jgi:hypothetical protein
MSPVRHAPAELTAGDTVLRAQYMNEVLGILYPNGEVVVGDNTGAHAEYLIVPDLKRPRLLVPAQDRKIAAAAVRNYAEPTSRTARMKRDAVVVALRTGASKMLLRDTVSVVGPAGIDSIDQYLAKVLGAGLSISVHIGPARANRKPVLQLLTAAGETVGFGKLGTGTLTRTLIRAETAALTTLNQIGMTNLAVPRLLHAGQWHGHEVLVQSALPSWLPRTTLSAKRLVAAMREVAGCAGTRTGSLAGCDFWTTLRARLDALTVAPQGAPRRADGTDRGAEARTLALAAGELIAGAGHTELRFGAWHGDWAPWNMATTSAALLVWDWERFTPGVPMGFDALHYDLQRLLDRGVDPGPAVDTILRRAQRLLAPFDVGAGAAQVTALLYLVELATRYLEDKQAEAGARLGVLGNWLLPVLTAKVAAL